MFSRIREDLASVFDRDPAARSSWEVLTCYPGFHALLVHRFAHWLWGVRLRWLARFVSHLPRWLTRLAIHPRPTTRRGGGAGGKILGPIVGGDGAKVGSNAVVVKDVPPGATAIGIPARIMEDRRE